tara:strand:- start:99 stop:311 length:213 start_codon:yes stop_codon:yes gene_type:complete
MKITFFATLYILMCAGVLVLATQQSIPQPIGLLVVAMVMTPVIVSVCGGLPVDFMSVKQSSKTSYTSEAN